MLISTGDRDFTVMPLSSAKRTRIPQIYHKIIDDLEKSLRDPSFLS